jgi:hypothetical protein
MALSVFRRRRPEALSEQMRAALAEISKNRADGYEVMEYPGAGLIPSAHCDGLEIRMVKRVDPPHYRVIFVYAEKNVRLRAEILKRALG